MQEPTASTPPGRDPLPRHTTPTWEMELLLSAATVFGLMQLPAMLDGVLYTVMPRFERETGILILLPYVYIKSAVQMLVLTFLLHLSLRGYWIALVGLASVYPAGVNWDGLRWGPVYARTVRRRFAPLPQLIERADNRASQVFGFGIGFAVALLAPLLLLGIASVLTYLLFLALGRSVAWLTLWNGMVALVVLPYMLAAAFDRMLGRRLAPDALPARVLGWIFPFYLRLGFGTFVNFPVTLFLSHYGRRRGGIAILLTVMLLVGASMLGQFRDRLGAEIGQYGALAGASAGEARTLLPAHYADRRGEAATLTPVPFIPTDVVDGDYLRLFIPYRPTRDNPALRRRCPGIESAADAEAALDRTLDCLALLYPIALDGIVIANPRFDRAEDPSTGLRGVQSMIRVAGLARGRHELQITRPPPGGSQDPGAKPEPPYVIPFWL
jgi:hypothetical protein